MIAYVCACGHKGKCEPGVPKFCPECGAGLTLGLTGLERKVAALTLAYVQKAARRYIGKGDDAPLLTNRQMDDRLRELRGVLGQLKAKKVTDLKDNDLKRFMDAMGLH